MHFNKSNTLFSVLFVCLVANAMAQDTIQSYEVEPKTYQYYTDKNWPELIKYGNKAVKEGYDYFYLQMRIGIAYYERENYNLAEGHFKKALKFNSNDELALEYLYYCYAFVGRTEDARMLSKKFSPELAERIGTKKLSAIGFIMLEGGTKRTDSTNYYDATKKTHSNYFNPATYVQLGIEHHIKRRVSLFHAVSYFDQQNFVGKVTQTQYYLKAAVPIKNNWLISPAFHWVNIKFSSQYLPIVTNTLMPPPKPITIVSQKDYYVGSIAIQKIVKKVTVSIGTTISNISSKNQYIHSGMLAYSVFGNSKLVIGCTEYIHTNDSYATINSATSPFIYFQPVSRFSIKASYLVNKNNNIIEDNGYLVNNSPDLTQSRVGGLANFIINKHIAVYGLYQLEFKKENVQGFYYRYNIIVGGIKIYP